ncbi:hypothetical protein NUU61_004115 [Penicillium alfredii]|uniref:Macro domain-like protein n=1 Tax=Penicillium alfredii TaxID=1506179 RepID=A0A9W9KDL8_9EURO|nr:uncharacterized protein NUU61_004115 [Penicillium alfredii]KAJ5101893.1 hypothetical protein NUU61_004115 [Penicillium alfredii]
MTSNIPEILLLCMDAAFITAFHEALASQWPDASPAAVKVTLINERLNSLSADTKFDLIVSPANSYGRLDGAFDHAISKAFAPHDDYHALTRTAQETLYEKWRGFAPPGTCTLVEFPAALAQNARGCRWVGLCPTMREPEDARWNREVVYECVWSLLCEVEGWNRKTTGDDPGRRIGTVLMSPLAAGVGKVSNERWAAQTVLALKHFVEAVENPRRWGQLQWGTIERVGDEINDTWKKT